MESIQSSSTMLFTILFLGVHYTLFLPSTISEIHLVDTNGSDSWCLQAIPDSLTTLSHNLSSMRRDFENIG